MTLDSIQQQFDAQINSNNSQPQTLLEVRNLVKTFKAVRAVDNVSFTIPVGQTISLIGPNGSGKTSVINLIAGYLQANSGDILFAGKRINKLRPENRAELGIARTFQNGRVFGNMSVQDNVLVGQHIHLQKARPFASLRHKPVLRWLSLIAEATVALLRPSGVIQEEQKLLTEAEQELRRFGERLLPRRDNLSYTLSYANRRRTEIARALASHPRLLLLDEPTAGMNPTETAEVLEQLLVLKQEGYTILLVEHKLDLVMQLSNHILVMDSGKLIAEGTPEEVQSNERVIEAYIGRKRSHTNRQKQEGVA